MKVLNFFRYFRGGFFKECGKVRIARVLVCSFVIALLWSFTDWMGGIYEPKFRDDVICLLLGIVLERLLPWGK